MSVSRDKLYEEVWAEPMTVVAKRYDVSSNFLARVCERLRVPSPPRGYWQRVQVGLPAAKPALPDAQPGQELEWSRNGTPARAPLEPPSAEFKRPGRVKERVEHHHLTTGMREHFEAGRDTHDGYLKPRKRQVVDLFVSRDALVHTLDMARELFLLLERRGHRVVMAPRGQLFPRASLEVREDKDGLWWDNWNGPERPTVVFIGTLAIGLTVFEVCEQAPVQWDNKQSKYVRATSTAMPVRRGRRDLARPSWQTSTRPMPSARIGLHAYAPYRGVEWARYWREECVGDFPGQFRSIARELEEAAKDIVKLVEEAERKAEVERRQWEAQRAKWDEEAKILAREEEERRQREAEKRRVEEFRKEVEKWRFARDLRALVGELKALLADRGLRMTKGSPVEEWAKWVEQQAEEADPLSALRRSADEMAAECRTIRPAGSPLGTLLALHHRRPRARWRMPSR